MRLRHLSVVLCILFCALAIIVLRETTGSSGGSPNGSLDGSPGGSLGGSLGGAESEGAGDSTTAAGVSEGAGKSEESKQSDELAKLELKRGLEFRKQELFDTAITIYRRGLEKDLSEHWNSEFLFEIGQTQYLMGKHELDDGATMEEAEPALLEALTTFNGVVEKYPSSKRAASSSHMTGSTYLVLEQPQRALKAFETTFDDFPNYVARSRTLLRSGMALVVLDRIPEGVAVFKRVIRDFPHRNGDVQRSKKYLSQLEIVGQKATPLRARTWLNNLVDDSDLASFEGEVIVLVFLATWCSSCTEAVPPLRKLIAEWSDRGVVFLGALNPKDSQNHTVSIAVEDYAKKNELEFLDVALIDDPRPWRAYRTETLPAAVVIDRRGVIRWRGHPELFPSDLVNNTLAE